MNACDYNPYELPTITFVGGETRDLAFHIYHYIGKRPYSLSDCDCTFSLVNFTTKGGKPIPVSYTHLTLPTNSRV